MKKIRFKGLGIRRKLGAKGLYLTLAACAVAAGGVGLAAYDRAQIGEVKSKYNVSSPDLPYTDIEEKLTDVPKLTKEDSSSESKADTSSSKAAREVKTQPNVMPVNGKILVPFSKGELVKSETLGYWKTHDGVDIQAEKGTAVKAMNKGTVKKIWEDALWGNCITIDHGDGVEGHYYNLSPEMMVQEGTQVNAGQIIGTIGDTASCEAAELSHLHFAIKKNGSWIDPIAYIDPSYVK